MEANIEANIAIVTTRVNERACCAGQTLYQRFGENGDATAADTLGDMKHLIVIYSRS